MPDVTITWCAPDGVRVVDTRVPAGATVAEAIRSSRILERHPEIDLAVNRIGIFNRLCEPGTVVQDGDRIEIYRPLVADPKTARRRRADRAQSE